MRRKKQYKRRDLGRVMAYSGIGVCGLLALAMLFPIAPGRSNALGEDVALSAGVSTKTTAYLYSTISVSTTGAVDIDIVPKSNGALNIGTAEVKVATNNTTGYTLYLSTADQTNRLNQIDSNLQYTGSTNANYIDSLKTTVSADDYLKSSANLNTWGYALTTGAANGDTEYNGITKSSGDVIHTVDSTSSNDSYNLNVAVAVDTSLPAGGYRNGLVVTAVANPVTISGFRQIYYMQEMTASVCDSAVEGETGQLIDSRDNKFYQVAKLKDGHCWMTQNLALDLTAGETLTSATTDVASDWTIPKSTENDIPLPNTQDNTDTRSWNLGQIVLAKPTNSSLCPTQNPATSGVEGENYPNNDQWNSAFTGQKITELCAGTYIDVSDGWIANADASLYSATSSINGKNYDPHYLIGNYYQYGTATAGTGIGITGTAATDATGAGLTNATGSICPKGWVLPKAGRNTSGTAESFGVGPGQSYEIDGSFQGLLSKYGYNTGWVANNGNGYMSITTGSERLDYSPLYFVRSGYVYPHSGSLRYAGNDSYVWSRTAYPGSNQHSYRLNFGTANVYPSNSSDRYVGFPVRCLAR